MPQSKYNRKKTKQQMYAEALRRKRMNNPHQGEKYGGSNVGGGSIGGGSAG